jgi:hypothetical protein
VVVNSHGQELSRLAAGMACRRRLALPRVRQRTSMPSWRLTLEEFSQYTANHPPDDLLAALRNKSESASFMPGSFFPN